MSQGNLPDDASPAGASDARAVRLLDELIRRAADKRASDIHIEPRQGRYRVRLRVDGVMVDDQPWPTDLARLVLNRIKVLARMDITERRLPQDGMFSTRLALGKVLSVRASSFPALHGEKLVLRLLLGGKLLGLGELGLDDSQVESFRSMSRRLGGLVVVTGPTGAGKTSTLYAMLRELDTRRRTVVTLEDPIEIEMQGVTQGQINPKVGFDFAGGLRSILRQDPDVILVGEMRDAETARIAVQASLTGHLVLSTLHTSSVPETVTRLIDMGLERYVVAGALLGVVAQRLVRRVCTACRGLVEPDRLARLRAEVGFVLPDGAGMTQGAGCEACLQTGFSGRTGIFEVVEVDDGFREIIKADGGGPAVRRLLKDRGVPTLRRAGVPLLQQGQTSLEELLRMT
jgi:general secretion pathway protein E